MVSRINKPWWINRGCPLVVGDSDHFWREYPPNNGTGLLILGQHYYARSPLKAAAYLGSGE